SGDRGCEATRVDDVTIDLNASADGVDLDPTVSVARHDDLDVAIDDEEVDGADARVASGEVVLQVDDHVAADDHAGVTAVTRARLPAGRAVRDERARKPSEHAREEQGDDDEYRQPARAAAAASADAVDDNREAQDGEG